MFSHDHIYECVISPTRDLTAKRHAVIINGVKFEFPLGNKCQVPGHVVSTLMACGMHVAVIPEADKDGFVRPVGERWEPRFSVSVLRDLTSSTEIGAGGIPAGGIVLDVPKTLEERSSRELRSMAQAMGIVHLGMSKDELISAIRAGQQKE